MYMFYTWKLLVEEAKNASAIENCTFICRVFVESNASGTTKKVMQYIEDNIIDVNVKLLTALTSLARKSTNIDESDVASIVEKLSASNKDFNVIVKKLRSVVENAKKHVMRGSKKIIKKDVDDALLGDIAFADERKGVKNEPDTQREKELYTSLKKYIIQNDSLPQKDVTDIETFLTLGWYDDVFHETDSSMIYRGMGVNEKYIKDALNLSNDEKLPDQGSNTSSFTFTPINNRSATSWTTTFDVAKYFTEIESDNYQLIMVANAPKKKNIAGKGGLYDVGELDVHSGEDEVIVFGPVHVRKILWQKRTMHVGTGGVYDAGQKV